MQKGQNCPLKTILLKITLQFTSAVHVVISNFSRLCQERAIMAIDTRTPNNIDANQKNLNNKHDIMHVRLAERLPHLQKDKQDMEQTSNYVQQHQLKTD